MKTKMATVTWWLMLVSLLTTMEAEERDTQVVPVRCCPRSDSEMPEQPTTPEVLPKVLAGVVTSTSLRAKKVLLENIYALRKYNVSWVALLYDGDDGSALDDVRALALSEDVPFRAYDARPSASLECPFCPKFQFHATLVRFARNFDYVILPDADISFRHFDWEGFWAAHRFAGAPLISQPLIRQNTQHTDYFVNSEQWELCPTKGERTMNPVRSVTTNLIENQIPFLDTSFFAYFAEETRGFTAYQQEHGTDWGQDRIWCLIAAVFADRFPGETENRSSCAIIFEAIDHEDHREIQKSEAFNRAGEKALKHIEMILRGRDSDSARRLNMTDLAAHTAQRLRHPYEDTVARVRRCLRQDDMLLA